MNHRELQVYVSSKAVARAIEEVGVDIPAVVEFEHDGEDRLVIRLTLDAQTMEQDLATAEVLNGLRRTVSEAQVREFARLYGIEREALEAFVSKAGGK